MKIICLECHREIGEKFPFDDPRATHTICSECIEKRVNGPGKGGLRKKVGRKSRRRGCSGTTADGRPPTEDKEKPLTTDRGHWKRDG